VARPRPILADVSNRATRPNTVPEPSSAPPANGAGHRPDLSTGLLEPFVRDTIAGTLLLRSPAEVPMEAELFQLGMDSLMALQLRGTLASRLDVDLPLRGLLSPGLTVGGLLDLIIAAAPGETPIAEAAESVDWEEGVL
jgi:acyl carrier protein